MTIRRAVFAPTGMGPLALASQAFGASFDVAQLAGPLDTERAPAERDPVQVLAVRGPMMHHDNEDFVSYDGILAAVRCEVALGTRALIVDYDSPGGLVSGMLETSRAMQAACKAAGVLHIAYVGSQCCSAAYGLACGADLIVAPSTSSSGSIGVIEALQDATRQATLMGLKFTLVTSGARKTDGNPMAGTTPEAIEARQTHVDDLALEFFEWVAQNRKGLTVESVRALEAGSFAGKRAKALGLVDRVQDLEALKKELAQALKASDDLGRNPPAALAPASKDSKGPPKMSAAREALQAICDDDKASDEDKQEAQTALDALGEEGGEDDEDKDKDKDKPDDKAEDEKKDEDEAKAAAAANPALAKALGLKPQAAVTVDSLLATRPDFDASTRALLKSQPLAVVRHACRTAPKQTHSTPLATARAGLNGARPKGAAPTPGAAPLQAAAQVGGPTPGAETVAPAFVPKTFTLKDEGHTQTFSVVRPRA